MNNVNKYVFKKSFLRGLDQLIEACPNCQNQNYIIGSLILNCLNLYKGDTVVRNALDM